VEKIYFHRFFAIYFSLKLEDLIGIITQQSNPRIGDCNRWPRSLIRCSTWELQQDAAKLPLGWEMFGENCGGNHVPTHASSYSSYFSVRLVFLRASSKISCRNLFDPEKLRDVSHTHSFGGS